MVSYKTKITLLLLLHIFICVNGQVIFTNRANPFAILISSLLLSIWFLQYFWGKPIETDVTDKNKRPWLYAMFAGLVMFSPYEELRKAIIKFKPPGNWSDVIPQVEAQSHWFWNGETPYQLLHFEKYSAFPVYMPIHWLPLGVKELVDLQSQWIGGFILLVFIMLGA